MNAWFWLRDEVSYQFRRRNMFWHWGYWVWPSVDFRLNSSLMYGASPYKSYRVGPFEYRRYV
jgi:hypothetical protein